MVYCTRIAICANEIGRLARTAKLLVGIVTILLVVARFDLFFLSRYGVLVFFETACFEQKLTYCFVVVSSLFRIEENVCEACSRCDTFACDLPLRLRLLSRRYFWKTVDNCYCWMNDFSRSLDIVCCRIVAISSRRTKYVER
mgnify:CR=1 FL=1